MRQFLFFLCFYLIQGSHIDITALSLNVWGLHTHSLIVPQRIVAIANHIQDVQYDVVVLQELWMKRDYDTVKNITADSYYITNFYDLSSPSCDGVWFPLGCSGLTILSKYPIRETSFKPFSVTGSFFYLDGEALVQKGIGRIRINPAPELRMDIFNIHTVANSYNKGYRETQISESAQKIEESDADIILFGGDINYDLRENTETSYQRINQILTDSCFSFENRSREQHYHVNRSHEQHYLQNRSHEQHYLQNRSHEHDYSGNSIESAMSTYTGNELYMDRGTAHISTNDFSEESESEILDYWFHGAKPGINIEVKEFQVLRLKEKILKEYSEEECSVLFDLELNCDLYTCSRLTKTMQKCGRKFCKNPQNAAVSLSDHEGVYAKYRISYKDTREQAIP